MSGNEDIQAPHHVAIVGAGRVGVSLAARLVETGIDVAIGVRPGRTVDDLPDGPGRARVVPVAAACATAEIVILAVPAGAAVAALEGIDLAGKIVVDCNNPVAFEDGSPTWTPPTEGSTTAQLAAAYPDAHIVKGFSTFGSIHHRDPNLLGRAVDTHLAGDDQRAKDTVAALAEKAGFRPIDVGPLRNAALVEALAVLWIHLAFGGRGPGFAFQLDSVTESS
ncbi:MAG: NAD(P)-binding domain-containing protein [Acidobacteriota bacterium]